jgi:L-malate glycosyltransferase
MRIGIVCYPTFGGSGVVATELGKALAEKGHQIHFISYSLPVRLDSFNQNIFYHEVNVSDYPLFEFPPYEVALSSKLVDVVKYEKLDLLHVHYAIPHASAACLAQTILAEQGIFIPFVTTLHGTDITLVGRDPSFAPVITYAINRSNAVTAVSESLKQDTFKHFNIKKDIEVIPNFINISEESLCFNDNPKKIFAPNNEKVLIHISNFRKVKRVEDVIYVFDKVLKKMPAKLLLAGDGPERQKIESLCRELGNCEHTKFLGKIKFTEQALMMADVFLLPSESESFGLAALEAMACGVPVISSNTGGIPEVNVENFSGFLSDVGNIDDMAEKAIQLLSDDEMLKTFKKNAKIQASKFEIDKILPMYEDLYKKVIEKHKLSTK